MGLELSVCKLEQLPSRRNNGTKLHNRCCTEFNDVVEAAGGRSLRIKLCSDGLFDIRISGDDINKGIFWLCSMDVGCVVIAVELDRDDTVLTGYVSAVVVGAVAVAIAVAVVADAFVVVWVWGVVSFETLRPTRVFNNCSKRLYLDGGACGGWPPFICIWGPSAAAANVGKARFTGRTRLALRIRA